MSSAREIKFESLAAHPWLKKSFGKLSISELVLSRAFLAEGRHLDQAAFEKAVNRMFLDCPQKPKNWAVIMELLCNSNSGRLPENIPE